MIPALYLFAITLTVAYLAGLLLAASEMGWIVEEDVSASPPADDARSSGRVSVAEVEALQAVNRLSPVQQTTLEGE